MPKIRSITYFSELYPDNSEADIQHIGHFVDVARQAFVEAGFEVQTTRLATQPFPQGLGQNNLATLPQLVKNVYAACQDSGIDYLSIGTVGLDDDPAYIHAIGDIIAEVEGVFATAVIADQEQGIDLSRLMDVAQLIQRLSTITADGMSNLYFAALANCGPSAPFFPVAYHAGGEPAFGLAIQAADLGVKAFHEAANPIEARDNLTQLIQETADGLSFVADSLAHDYGMTFSGLDFSLAPYPETNQSLGHALEGLGAQFGGNGMVAAASLIMNAIEAAQFNRAGFSGLMLPILEDNILAERAQQGRLSINELLLLSAVCGTGLDCIPLAGDISANGLRDILLDTAALALRLDKPLTARLLPFPHKQAGDALSFGFEYFADGAVMPNPLTNPNKFDTNMRFNITPRVKLDNS